MLLEIVFFQPQPFCKALHNHVPYFSKGIHIVNDIDFEGTHLFWELIGPSHAHPWLDSIWLSFLFHTEIHCLLVIGHPFCDLLVHSCIPSEIY